MRRKSTCVFGAQVTFGIIATTSPSKLFRNCSSLLWSLVILISNRWTLYFVFLPPSTDRFSLWFTPPNGLELLCRACCQVPCVGQQPTRRDSGPLLLLRNFGGPQFTSSLAQSTADCLDRAGSFHARRATLRLERASMRAGSLHQSPDAYFALQRSRKLSGERPI